MTKEEQSTLTDLQTDIQRLTEVVIRLAEMQLPGRAVAYVQESEPQGLDAIVVALQSLETFNLDQVVSMRYQELVPAGTHFIGDPDKLRAWIRREYLQELEDRGKTVVIRR